VGLVTEEDKDEKIFELTQEVTRLKGQITYLQEELASAEDSIYRLKDRIAASNYE
jgi:peptidoglycan hydrolase CwlO-like protein